MAGRSQRHLYEVQGYTVIGSGTEPAYEEVTYPPPVPEVIVNLANAFSAESRREVEPEDDD